MTLISFRIEDELKLELDEYCKNTGRSLSGCFRIAVRQLLENEKHG